MQKLTGLSVYVVIASSHYQSAKAIAVRLKVEQAKRLAEKLEPDKKFEWRNFPNGAFIEGGFPDGPYYSYSIEPIEVKIE